jgi:CxxC motif-containing protein (DUF1111 family)
MKKLRSIIILLFFGLFLMVWGLSLPRLEAGPELIAVSASDNPALGLPLAGINAAQQKLFDEGKKEFEFVHTPEDGLGPVFNHESCVACHNVPATGGSLANLADRVIRIGRTKNGKFDPLANLGGQVLSRKTIASLLRGCNQPGSFVPPEADFISLRFAQPVFGLGLLEAVLDETILANADPEDKNRDGVSGRANMIKSVHFSDTRLGRFGWKAQIPTLIDFCGDAYLVENGITSPDFPQERQPNGKAIECDPTPDPEDNDGSTVQAFVNYITLLAAPPRGQINDSVLAGEKIFASMNCTACHIPLLKTGPSLIDAIAGKEIQPYTDLLLHDMGQDLADNIEQGMANGSEWRTQPLWGLSKKKFFLHDGRTSDITTAIILHGGEALKSRNAFLKLKSKDRADLLSFLNSL